MLFFGESKVGFFEHLAHVVRVFFAGVWYVYTNILLSLTYLYVYVHIYIYIPSLKLK